MANKFDHLVVQLPRFVHAREGGILAVDTKKESKTETFRSCESRANVSHTTAFKDNKECTWSLSVWRRRLTPEEGERIRLGNIVSRLAGDSERPEGSDATTSPNGMHEDPSQDFNQTSISSCLQSLHAKYIKVTKDASVEMSGETTTVAFHIPTPPFILHDTTQTKAQPHSSRVLVLRVEYRMSGTLRAVGLTQIFLSPPSGEVRNGTFFSSAVLSPLLLSSPPLSLFALPSGGSEPQAAAATALFWVPHDTPGQQDFVTNALEAKDCLVVPVPPEDTIEIAMAVEPIMAALSALAADRCNVGAFSVMAALSHPNGALIDGPYICGAAAKVQSADGPVWKSDFSSIVSFSCSAAILSSAIGDAATARDPHIILYVTIPPGFLYLHGACNERALLIAFAFFQLTRISSSGATNSVAFFDAFGAGTDELGLLPRTAASDLSQYSWTEAELLLHAGCPAFLPADAETGESLFEGICAHRVVTSDTVSPSSSLPWAIPAHLRLSAQKMDDISVLDDIDQCMMSGALPTSFRVLLSCARKPVESDSSMWSTLVAAASPQTVKNDSYNAAMAQTLRHLNICKPPITTERSVTNAIRFHLALLNRMAPGTDGTAEILPVATWTQPASSNLASNLMLLALMLPQCDVPILGEVLQSTEYGTAYKPGLLPPGVFFNLCNMLLEGSKCADVGMKAVIVDILARLLIIAVNSLMSTNQMFGIAWSGRWNFAARSTTGAEDPATLLSGIVTQAFNHIGSLVKFAGQLPSSCIELAAIFPNLWAAMSTTSARAEMPRCQLHAHTLLSSPKVEPTMESVIQKYRNRGATARTGASTPHAESTSQLLQRETVEVQAAIDHPPQLSFSVLYAMARPSLSYLLTTLDKLVKSDSCHHHIGVFSGLKVLERALATGESDEELLLTCFGKLFLLISSTDWVCHSSAISCPLMLAALAAALRVKLALSDRKIVVAISELAVAGIQWISHAQRIQPSDSHIGCPQQAAFWLPYDVFTGPLLAVRVEHEAPIQWKGLLMDSLFSVCISDAPATQQRRGGSNADPLGSVRQLKQDLELLARPEAWHDADATNCTPACRVFLASLQALMQEQRVPALRRVGSQASVASVSSEFGGEEHRTTQFIWRCLIRYGCLLINQHFECFDPSQLGGYGKALSNNVRSPVNAYASLLLRLLLTVVEGFGTLIVSRAAVTSSRHAHAAALLALLKEILSREVALKKTVGVEWASVVAETREVSLSAAGQTHALRLLHRILRGSGSDPWEHFGNCSPCVKSIARNFLRYLQVAFAAHGPPSVVLSASKVIDQLAVASLGVDCQFLRATATLLGDVHSMMIRSKGNVTEDAVFLGLASRTIQRMFQLCNLVHLGDVVLPSIEWFLRHPGQENRLRLVKDGAAPDAIVAPYIIRALLIAAVAQSKLASGVHDHTEVMKVLGEAEGRVADAVVVAVRSNEWKAANEVLLELYSAYVEAASMAKVDIPPVSTWELGLQSIAALLNPASSVAEQITASSFATTVRAGDTAVGSKSQRMGLVLQRRALLVRCIRTAIAFCSRDPSLQCEVESIVSVLSLIHKLHQAPQTAIPSFVVELACVITPALAAFEAPPELPARFFAIVASGPSFDSSGGQHLQPVWFVIEAADETSGDAILEDIRNAWPDAIVHGPDAPISIAKFQGKGAEEFYWVGSGTASEHVYGCEVEDTPVGKCLRVDMPLGPTTPDHIHVFPCYAIGTDGEAGTEFCGWVARSNTIELQKDATSVYVHPVGLQGPCLSREKFNITKSNPEDLVEDAERTAVMRFHLRPNTLSVHGTTGWLASCVPAELREIAPQPLGSALLEWTEMACQQLHDCLTWFKGVAPGPNTEAHPQVPTNSGEDVSDLLQEDITFLDGPSLGGRDNSTLFQAAAAVRQALATSPSFVAASPLGRKQKWAKDVRLDDLLEVDEDLEADTEFIDDDSSTQPGNELSLDGFPRPMMSPQRLFRQPTVRQLASTAVDFGSEETEDEDATANGAQVATRGPVSTRKAATLISPPGRTKSMDHKKLDKESYRPRLGQNTSGALEAWLAAPGRMLSDIPYALQPHLLALPPRASILIPLHSMQRVTFAQLHDLLSPNWTFCTGPRVSLQLLQDYAELKLTWCEKIVTEKRREYLREESALIESGVDVSNREMPDFTKLVNKAASPSIHALESRVQEFLALSTTLRELFVDDLCVDARESMPMVHLLEDAQTSIYAGFEALAQV